MYFSCSLGRPCSSTQHSQRKTRNGQEVRVCFAPPLFFTLKRDRIRVIELTWHLLVFICSSVQRGVKISPNPFFRVWRRRRRRKKVGKSASAAVWTLSWSEVGRESG